MLAIRVAQVFDGTAVLSGCNMVLIDAGAIVAIRSDLEPVPPGSETIEYPGATLMPGLIDTHVHPCADNGPGALDRLPAFRDQELVAIIERSLRQHLAVGVTTVRDLGDRRWAVVNWRSRQREHIASLSLPTVVAAGPLITSRGGHCWNMGGEASGIDELRRAVAERAERGADIVKVMASGGAMTPGTDVAKLQFSVAELTVLAREAHSLGLPVTAHAHALTAIEAALDAGIDGIEHCSFITETGMEVRPDLVRRVAEARVVCPTLGIAAGATPPPALLEIMRRTGMTYESRQQTIAELHLARVSLTSGSDGGINPGKPHGVLPKAVVDMSAGGVPEADALASARAVAADACGVGDRKGRLRTGYDADLLIVDGDPLTEITAVQRPLAVYLGGSRVG